ncbi:hypothetical protein F4824DRAFT_517685 [Ustulina deusta]|nr:hypothetical protein F4824DRAFT_517685 [Ustulina deusta]
MANRFRFDLKTFEVSSKTFDLSLSMTSRAFIYDVGLGNITQDDLSSLILSKQLWLLPRGLCRLDVHVRLGECDIRGDERDDFLDFIADTICQSSVWSQLSLSVQILDVQYHREEGSIPHLYFGIEQPDMSSALLSPPYTRTAQLKGLECILQLQSSSHLEASSEKEEQTGSESPLSSGRMIYSAGFFTSHQAFDVTDLVELWDNVAYLVEAAFCITFGTRKRMRGLSIFEPEKAPSLLNLAPAIWNSWYRRSIVSHTRKFAVISNIFASSLNGQSPELRRKGVELLKGAPAEINDDSNHHSVRHLESSIQRMLWDLLQDTLEPTIGKSNRTTRKAISPNAELDCQDDGINRTMVDEGCFEQYESFDEHHHLYGKLSPSIDQRNDRYQSNASCNSDSDLAWKEANHPTFLQDNQTLGVAEFHDGIGHSCSEANISRYQLLDPYSQHFESDLSSAMEDQLMSDYMYDEDEDIYDCEYDYIVPTGEGFNGYNLTDATTSCWEGEGENSTQGK